MLEQWSVSLAEAIAPDEAVLAPLVAQAYAAGGTQRAELFREARNTHGAFGAGEVITLLPFALKAVSIAGPALLGLLSSNIVGDVLECAKSALNLVEVGHSVHGALAARGAAAHAVPQLDLLRNVLDAIPRELQASGMADDKCNETTLRILRVLLADPKAATQAISELTAS